MFKNRILYLSALTGGIWVMTMYQNYYAVLAAGIIFAVPLILLFFFVYLTKNLTMTIHIDDSIISKNDEKGIPVHIDIENRSRIPLTCGSLFIRFQNRYLKVRVNKRIPLAAAAKNITHISYFIKAKNIGIADITVSHGTYYDMLGLWRKKVKVNRTDSIPVIPEIVPLELDIRYLQNENESEKYREDIKGNDNGEIFDIREYNEGDQLKRIHWKLSSRKDSLMVKEFSMPVEKLPLIFINMQKTGSKNRIRRLKSLDNLLEASISLSYAMISKEISHIIAWHDVNRDMTKSRHIESEDDLTEAVHELLDTRQSSIFSIPEDLSTLPVEREYSHIFYLTPVLNNQMIHYLYGLRDYADSTIIHITKSGFNKELGNLCAESDIELLWAENAAML